MAAARDVPSAARPASRAPRAAAGAFAVEPLVLIGDPADALLRVSGRAGLLVLGSRAYGPPGVVLPGGAARRVAGRRALSGPARPARRGRRGAGGARVSAAVAGARRARA